MAEVAQDLPVCNCILQERLLNVRVLPTHLSESLLDFILLQRGSASW